MERRQIAENHLTTIHRRLQGEEHFRSLLGRPPTHREELARSLGFERHFARSEQLVTKEQLDELELSIEQVRSLLFKIGEPLTHDPDYSYYIENEMVSEQDADQIYLYDKNGFTVAANKNPRENVFGRMSLHVEDLPGADSIIFAFSYTDFVNCGFEFSSNDRDHPMRFEWEGHIQELSGEEYEIFRAYADTFLEQQADL
jgi:hypothetical protein